MYSIAGSVGDRQRARQAEADRADGGVRLEPERRRAAAEHLGPRAELDVRLQPDHRLVPGQRLVVRHQLRRHRAITQVPSPEPAAGRPSAAPVPPRRARGDPVRAVVGERRCHDLQPDRQAVLGREPARHRDRRVAGQIGRDRAQVGQVHGHRVVGPLPDRERGRRGGRRDQHVDLLERRVEVPADQRAHLLRLAVVGVVVAARQRVRAEHDPALDLRAEAGRPGQRHDLVRARGCRRRRSAGRSASRRTGPGSTSTRWARSGNRPAARR